MLWPLLILGYAVLVTSRPSSSIADDLLDGVTWRVLPPMLRQESSQWMSPYDRPKTGINKRVLSILSRWKPLSVGFNNLVGHYPSRTQDASVVPELDFVSAETRGSLRPSGQPLRWGRR